MKNYDYSKLLGRIKEKFGSNTIFAANLGISERTLSFKLNNKVDFRQREIDKSCELLDISDNDISSHFFKEKTQ